MHLSLLAGCARLCLCGALLSLVPAALGNKESKERERLEKRSQRITEAVRHIHSQRESQVPASVIREAKGVIILKQYEAGVIFGAKGGFGISMRKKENGSWGPPAWVRTAEISGGLQLGAQQLNVLLVIMNEKSLEILKKRKFQLGVDATVTRGPVGSNYEARTGIDADILVYTDFSGYYAGATFDGSLLLPDRRTNELTYSERLEIADIIDSQELQIPEFLHGVATALHEIEFAGQLTAED